MACGWANDFGFAVDLNIVGAAELIAVDQQGDARIAPDVLDLVGAVARRDRHAAVGADHRRDQGHLQRAVSLARHQHAVMIAALETLELR